MIFNGTHFLSTSLLKKYLESMTVCGFVNVCNLYFQTNLPYRIVKFRPTIWIAETGFHLFYLTKLILLSTECIQSYKVCKKCDD